MKNGNMPATPIKINERIEDPQTGQVTINQCDEYFEGLTKREHFAGLAMQGIASDSFGEYSGKTWADDLASDAIQLADALLKGLKS